MEPSALNATPLLRTTASDMSILSLVMRADIIVQIVRVGERRKGAGDPLAVRLMTCDAVRLIDDLPHRDLVLLVLGDRDRDGGGRVLLKRPAFRQIDPFVLLSGVDLLVVGARDLEHSEGAGHKHYWEGPMGGQYHTPGG